MKFKDFLTEYGAVTPPGLNWPNQHADIPKSFGDMAQRSQMNRNFRLQIDAVQSLQNIINTIWPNPSTYGATISGTFPNATVSLPSIVNPKSMGSRSFMISGPSLNTCNQLGMLQDDGNTTVIYVKPVYDFKMKEHPINTVASAADNVVQATTAGGDPKVQNWRYEGQ